MLIFDKITRLADKAGWSFEYYKEHSKAVFHSDYSSVGFYLDLNMPDIEVYEYVKESLEDFSYASDDFYRRRAIISKERTIALEAQQKLIKVLQDAVNEDEKYVAIKKIAEEAGWEAEYTGIPKAPNLWAQLTFTCQDHSVSTPMSWEKPLNEVLALLKNDLLKTYNGEKELYERFAKPNQTKTNLKEERHRTYELKLIQSFENALGEKETDDMVIFNRIKKIAENIGWKTTYSEGGFFPPYVIFKYKENRILITVFPEGSLLKNLLHVRQHLWKHFSNFDETEFALLTLDDNLTPDDMKEYRMAEQTLYEAFEKAVDEEKKTYQEPQTEV